MNQEPDYLKSLNSEQKKAVVKTEGPLLILAGAGAGKTKTLTHRILHLIKNGVAPENILAITFTNKAAKEMKERIEKLIREDRDLNLPISSKTIPFASTFHSLGVHILKENASLLKIPRHFGIFDKSDSKKAVKEAVVSLNLDPKQFEPGKMSSLISKEKGKFITSENFEADHVRDYFSEILSKVWNKYEEILRKEKAFDFDDLLLKTAKLLEKNENVRKHYQNIWKYIHIDEYQDTNEVQYVISKLLSEKHQNICVVGDIDQNIYSWRGANIKNIMNFEKDYPDAEVVILEENYRSTQTIIKAANIIIDKNRFRVKKNLFTKNPEGEKIGRFEGFDENHEAQFVAQKSQELIEKGVSPEEIAVLYRANFQSRALEEAFLKNSVPYQMLGVRFFERAEIKDILSFIKASLNPDSLTDIKRIINVPPRGIGKVTLLKIFEGKESELPAGMKKKVSDFRYLLEKIKNKALKDKTSETVKFVMKESGMENSLKKDSDEDMERLENMRELATLASKYDEMEPEEGIEKLLSEAALATDQDSLSKNERAVKLMTVHAAKGLEFDYVFVTGLEENLFPHKKLGEEEIEDEDAEEERRLFYVALTRGKKKVYLTNAQMRTIFGSREINIPSEFIGDIDEELLEFEDGNEGGGWRRPLINIEF